MFGLVSTNERLRGGGGGGESEERKHFMATFMSLPSYCVETSLFLFAVWLR